MIAPFLTVEFVFSSLLIVGLTIALIKGMWGLSYSTMFNSEGETDKVSYTKFWANIAYFVATISFIRLNFSESDKSYMPELWLIFLGVVGSNAVVAKWLALRYLSQPQQQESQQVNPQPPYYPIDQQPRYIADGETRKE